MTGSRIGSVANGGNSNHDSGLTIYDSRLIVRKNLRVPKWRDFGIAGVSPALSGEREPGFEDTAFKRLRVGEVLRGDVRESVIPTLSDCGRDACDPNHFNTAAWGLRIRRCQRWKVLTVSLG